MSLVFDMRISGGNFPSQQLCGFGLTNQAKIFGGKQERKERPILYIDTMLLAYCIERLLLVCSPA